MAKNGESTVLITSHFARSRKSRYALSMPHMFSMKSTFYQTRAPRCGLYLHMFTYFIMCFICFHTSLDLKLGLAKFILICSSTWVTSTCIHYVLRTKRIVLGFGHISPRAENTGFNSNSSSVSFKTRFQCTMHVAKAL